MCITAGFYPKAFWITGKNVNPVTNKWEITINLIFCIFKKIILIYLTYFYLFIYLCMYA